MRCLWHGARLTGTPAGRGPATTAVPETPSPEMAIQLQLYWILHGYPSRFGMLYQS